MKKDKFKNYLFIIVFLVAVILSLILIHHFYFNGHEEQKSDKTTTTSSTSKNSDRTPKKVSMVVDKSNISSTKLTVVITDNNDDPYGYGTKFEIQEKVDGLWVTLDYTDANPRWNAIAYVPNEDKQIVLDIDISKYYGPLKKGTYRVVKELLDDEKTSIYSDEFKIKN